MELEKLTIHPEPAPVPLDTRHWYHKVIYSASEVYMLFIGIAMSFDLHEFLLFLIYALAPNAFGHETKYYSFE